MLLKLIAPADESLPLAIMGDHWDAMRTAMAEFAKIEPRAAAAPEPLMSASAAAADPVPAVSASDAAAAPRVPAVSASDAAAATVPAVNASVAAAAPVPAMNAYVDAADVEPAPKRARMTEDIIHISVHHMPQQSYMNEFDWAMGRGDPKYVGQLPIS